MENVQARTASVKHYPTRDEDLPRNLWPHNANQSTKARARIGRAAEELGLTIDREQIDLFGIVLVALEEIEAAAPR